MLLHYLYIFFISLLESFLLGMNFKFMQRGKKLPSYITSSINALMYLTVLGIAVENLHNFWAKVVYIQGFALGDVLTLLLDSKLEKISKRIGVKWRKFRKASRRRKR
jgi:uncharacterized protein YebE (UPF0316 family)